MSISYKYEVHPIIKNGYATIRQWMEWSNIGSNYKKMYTELRVRRVLPSGKLHDEVQIEIALEKEFKSGKSARTSSTLVLNHEQVQVLIEALTTLQTRDVA